jgi:hypothetical protein
MTSETIERQRREIYEIAEAIAPGWDRWRARIEDTTTPVREWMIRELAPQPGDTVLELAAGAGDTGFEAAAIVGERRGRLISTDFSPAMVQGSPPPRRRARTRERAPPGDGRGAHRARRRLGRRGALPVRLHADARSRRGVRRDAPRAAPRRAPRAGCLGRARAQPVGRDRLRAADRARPHAATPAPGPFALASEEQTRALLEGAGFTAVRTEEIPVRFSFRDLDDYTTYATDTGGPAALVLRGLPDDERETLKTQLRAAFAPFAADGGYEIPGVALCAAAD